jgi:O-methyltransferase
VTPEWFERVCMSALGHRSSQEQTYDIARLVLQRGIPGDFVECGVYAGASCALMARALMDEAHEGAGVSGMPAVTRRVHLFDSFAGIPAPGQYDTELAANGGGESAVSIEDVQANMKAWGIPDELLVYRGGDFTFTIPWAIEESNPLAVKQIALLRLDGDLYESTRVSLEHLYPLVSPGGYVIVDDFNLSGARKAVIEYFKHSGPAPIAWRKPE